MRTKKDPCIRREAFISAATKLYMDKGCDGVSIRDILDAVADKTASPSVFYYYFSSKDELYRACVKTVADCYLASMKEAFFAEGKTIAEWMLGLVSGLEEYLISERNLIKTGSSSGNRAFILDMKEQVTEQVALLWASGLEDTFGIPAPEAFYTARFLAGGIGEIMFDHMQGDGYDQAAVFTLTENIVRLVINTIGLPDDQKNTLLETLKEKHGRILK